MAAIEDRKRLHANEREALLHLCAALQGFASASALDKRIASIKGAKSMVNGAKGMLGKAIAKIYDTMPVEQLLSFRRQLKGLRYSINIQNVAGKDYSNDGVWLSLEALDALCGATKDHCLMCMKDITKLIPWIKAKTTNEQQAFLLATIKTLVFAAEQLYGAGEGEAKLDYVETQLKEKGYTVDRAQIEAVIKENIATLHSGKTV